MLSLGEGVTVSTIKIYICVRNEKWLLHIPTSTQKNLEFSTRVGTIAHR